MLMKRHDVSNDDSSGRAHIFRSKRPCLFCSQQRQGLDPQRAQQTHRRISDSLPVALAQSMQALRPAASHGLGDVATSASCHRVRCASKTAMPETRRPCCQHRLLMRRRLCPASHPRKLGRVQAGKEPQPDAATTSAHGSAVPPEGGDEGAQPAAPQDTHGIQQSEPSPSQPGGEAGNAAPPAPGSENEAAALARRSEEGMAAADAAASSAAAGAAAARDCNGGAQRSPPADKGGQGSWGKGSDITRRSRNSGNALLRRARARADAKRRRRSGSDGGGGGAEEGSPRSPSAALREAVTALRASPWLALWLLVAAGGLTVYFTQGTLEGGKWSGPKSPLSPLLLTASVLGLTTTKVTAGATSMAALSTAAGATWRASGATGIVGFYLRSVFAGKRVRVVRYPAPEEPPSRMTTLTVWSASARALRKRIIAAKQSSSSGDAPPSDICMFLWTPPGAFEYIPPEGDLTVVPDGGFLVWAPIDVEVPVFGPLYPAPAAPLPPAATASLLEEEEEEEEQEGTGSSKEGDPSLKPRYRLEALLRGIAELQCERAEDEERLLRMALEGDERLLAIHAVFGGGKDEARFRSGVLRLLEIDGGDSNADAAVGGTSSRRSSGPVP